MMNAYQENKRTNQTALYLFARCEQFIRDYAESASLPAHVLADRVGELLLSQTRGGVLGAANPLSTLRGNSSRNGSAPSEMEVAGSSRRSAQIKRPVGRPRNARHPFMKGYSYQGKHWTQKLANKKRLREQMKRNTALRLQQEEQLKLAKVRAAKKQRERRARRAKILATAERNPHLAHRAGESKLNRRRRMDRERKQMYRALKTAQKYEAANE